MEDLDESEFIKSNVKDKTSNDQEDDSDEDSNKLYREYIDKMKSMTRRNSSVILSYYASFILMYPDGRVGKKDFIENIVYKLIVESENIEGIAQSEDVLRQEKIEMCERLFDICNVHGDGKVDFLEYFTLFWSRAEGSSYEKLALIFEMYDLNQSDFIDFNELHTIVKNLLKLKYSTEALDSQADQKKIEQRFSHFQKLIFMDNVVTNPKLPLSYNIAMYIMTKLDTLRLGKLSKDEFVNGCLNNENIKKFLLPLKVFL